MRISAYCLWCIATLSLVAAAQTPAQQIKEAERTGDPRFYLKARDALMGAMSTSTNARNDRILLSRVLLQLGDIPAALKLAEQVHQELPDDLAGFGLIADAQLAQGNYAQAEDAINWMLRLRSTNPLGLERAARLREIYGDPEGAIEFLTQVYQKTPPEDKETCARLLTRIGLLRQLKGDTSEAHASIRQALTVSAHNPEAMAALASIYESEGSFAEAIALRTEKLNLSNWPADLYRLALAERRAGHLNKAKEEANRFANEARALATSLPNANLELILYDSESGNDGAEAIRVAEKGLARRHDTEMLDAYAMALYANGQFAAAREQIAKALEPGTRDARYFCDAAAIHRQLKDEANTAKYVRLAMRAGDGRDCAPQFNETR